MQGNDGVCIFHGLNSGVVFFPSFSRIWRVKLQSIMNKPFLYCCSEFDNIFLDYSRQQASPDTIKKLYKLADVSTYSVACSVLIMC